MIHEFNSRILGTLDYEMQLKDDIVIVYDFLMDEDIEQCYISQSENYILQKIIDEPYKKMTYSNIQVN